MDGQLSWVPCQALGSSCCSKQLQRGQGPEAAVRAMKLGAGSWPNKVAHDREGDGGQGEVRREGRCQEGSGEDGWMALGAGGWRLQRGMPMRADGGERRRRATDVPGPISASAVTFRALMCTFFVCGQLGRNLFALPQKMRPL